MHKKVRIFYADDDLDDTFFFQNVVEEIGADYELFIFPNGVQLLKNLNIDESLHNIVFLDVNMPLKNGLECLREIRENDNWIDLPVFLISTSNSDMLKEQAAKNGATGYIEKPSNFNDLKDKVQGAIGSTLPA